VQSCGGAANCLREPAGWKCAGIANLLAVPGVDYISSERSGVSPRVCGEGLTAPLAGARGGGAAPRRWCAGALPQLWGLAVRPWIDIPPYQVACLVR